MPVQTASMGSNAAGVPSERASSLHNDRFRNKGANGEDRFEIVVKEFERYQSNFEASSRLF